MIHASRAAAFQAIGALPEFRSTIVTLFGSASRWLMLTWKSAALVPGPAPEPEPDAGPDGVRTVPPIPMAGALFLPTPRESEERALDDASGTGGVLTETDRPPPPALTGSCDGIESMSCDE